MFFHIFKYRIKTILHTKEEVFWILIFPIILGTCFYAAFSNISSSTEEFHTINVAVVLENNENDTLFKNVLDSIENSEAEEPLLAVTYTDAKKADELLSDKEVSGIITLNEGTPSLKILGDGINESILKEFLDQYLQSISVLTSIEVDDMSEFSNIVNKLTSDTSYIEVKKLTDGNTDILTDYYYSLIAMACLFGSLSGQSCAMSMKANLSPLGMRKTLSPASRLSVILGDFFATYLLQIVANTLLVLYLNYILNVNLGGNILLVFVTTWIGSLIGVSQGMLVGSLPRLGEAMKITINIALPLFSSFLSGLMVGGIKYQIDKFAPIINKLNPATVITDALYSLNIFDTYGNFIQCMITLVLYCVVFCSLSYFMTRRESYASV
ncbi:MAG: ABC transporter permease [Lachnospiraceae bacterium]|nr:ABC transporter permease [Lachnospiraceae bacterium]